VFVSPPSAYRTSASRSCFPINYGVVDEIARRVWLNGGRVLAVRCSDIPGKGSLAAILRYAP
jgi:hypothetical protein